jgi:hypothetical protein
LLNILLELSPLEVFVKCYKLRATKYTLKLQGTFCSPEFVTLYKELQGR